MSRNRTRISKLKKIKRGISYQEFVGNAIRTFDPDAKVKVEQWIPGPDGRRDMDVVVECFVDNKPHKLLIECKDYDLNKTGKVGIELVDAIDSKKQDLDINTAMICSNSGFTSEAIHKAKRKNIGLITIIKAGDPNVKAVIETEIYTRQIEVEKIDVTFMNTQSIDIPLSDIYLNNLPFLNWIYKQIAVVVSWHPLFDNSWKIFYDFIEPVEFTFGNQKQLSTGIEIKVTLQTTWYSHNVILDASLAMYDYITEKLNYGPGENKYIIKGIDFNNGQVLDYNPYKYDQYEKQTNELSVNMMVFKNFSMPKENEIPNLDQYIKKEDLESDFSPFSYAG